MRKKGYICISVHHDPGLYKKQQPHANERAAAAISCFTGCEALFSSYFVIFTFLAGLQAEKYLVLPAVLNVRIRT